VGLLVSQSDGLVTDLLDRLAGVTRIAVVVGGEPVGLLSNEEFVRAIEPGRRPGPAGRWRAGAEGTTVARGSGIAGPALAQTTCRGRVSAAAHPSLHVPTCPDGSP